MSNFARVVMGFAAFGCLSTGGCGKSSTSTLPSGSMAEAPVCTGNKIVATDVNEDGRPDIEHVKRGGRRYCSKADMNFDGKIDMERFYEDDGKRVAHERHDFDFDGRIDQLSFYEEGQLIRKELDTNFDNAIDTWLWCGEGWVTRSERDRQRDGQVDVWEVYEEGLIIEASYDNDNNGRVERWESFRDGRLVQTKFDDDGDGEPDRTDTVPIHNLGPADDAFRCERTEDAQVAASPASQGES